MIAKTMAATPTAKARIHKQKTAIQPKPNRAISKRYFPIRTRSDSVML